MKKPRMTQEDTGMTLEQLGKRLYLTRERVRQVEMHALQKCQRVLKDRGIDADVWRDYMADN